MKKVSIIFLSLLILAGASAALAQNGNAVSIGQRSDEVKTIQEALKSDKSIYPEGLTTGYFGSATKKAVARVQAKCGLAQTGTVDEDTTKCIFPVDYQVTVISPNGGETWDRSQIQIIRWATLSSNPAPASEPGTSNGLTMPRRPIWSKASIDLFKKQNVVCIQAPCLPISIFVKHLGTVNLFGGSYSWKISNDIANSSDYVIRISAGQNIMPLWKYEQEGGSLQTTQIWPGPSGNWDESDSAFTISGNVVPPVNDLSQVIKILQEMSEQLAKAIQLLREMNQTQ